MQKCLSPGVQSPDGPSKLSALPPFQTQEISQNSPALPHTVSDSFTVTFQDMSVKCSSSVCVCTHACSQRLGSALLVSRHQILGKIHP